MLTGDNLITVSKTWSPATLPTTNHTRVDPGSSSGSLGKRLGINHLSHGEVCNSSKWRSQPNIWNFVQEGDSDKNLARIFLSETREQWEEGGRRILLGDNTGGRTVITFRCVGVWISIGIPFVHMYIWPYVYSVPTCSNLHSRRTFRNVRSYYESRRVSVYFNILFLLHTEHGPGYLSR